MTSQEKLFEFFYILLNKRKTTASFIAGHFGVTTRTVYRWCDSLSMAGIPIITTQGKGGGISLMENYSIDSAVFSDSEKLALSSSLNAIANLAEGDMSDYTRAAEKISSLVSNASDWIKIDFAPWNQAGTERRQIFDTIKNAILSGKQISFDYYGTNQQHVQSRSVQPWQIIFRGQAWYLWGFCNTRMQARFFKLSRIKNIQLSKLKSTVRHENSSDEEGSTVYNQLSEFPMLKIQCIVKNSMLSYLLDEVTNVQILQQKEEEALVQFMFPEAHFALGFFLGFGSAIKILKPKSLAGKIQRECERISRLYK